MVNLILVLLLLVSVDSLSGVLPSKLNMVEEPPPLGSQMPAPNILYGTVCQVNFWMKMTTALGVTQIVIGLACMVFYCVVYLTDCLQRAAMLDHLAAYVSVGVLAGMVVSMHLHGNIGLQRFTNDLPKIFFLRSNGFYLCFQILCAGIMGSVASRRKTKCKVYSTGVNFFNTPFLSAYRIA